MKRSQQHAWNRHQQAANPFFAQASVHKYRFSTCKQVKLARWPVQLDLINLSLYIWLVIHPFEIINTQPSCRYRCLDFKISIGTPEFCCLGGIGLVDGNLIANDTINVSLHPRIHCKLCSFVYWIEIINHPLWHLSVPPRISLSAYSLPYFCRVTYAFLILWLLSPT
jgi:hypothetical protein